MFDRYKKSICSPKEEVISTNKETVYMVVNFFLLRNGLLLDLKQNTLFANFSMLFHAI